MICDENADILIFQPPYHILNFLYSDGVNAGEGLIEHYESRLNSQTSGNFRTSALSSGKAVSQILSNMGEIKFADELLEFLCLIFFGEIRHFQYGFQIILN